MNQENLNKLIKQYEDNLDRLYGSEHYELFKWQAIPHHAPRSRLTGTQPYHGFTVGKTVDIKAEMILHCKEGMDHAEMGIKIGYVYRMGRYIERLRYIHEVLRSRSFDIRLIVGDEHVRMGRIEARPASELLHGHPSEIAYELDPVARFHNVKPPSFIHQVIIPYLVSIRQPPRRYSNRISK